MQCYRPIRLTVDNYFYKNGIQNARSWQLVPCGKCLACLSHKKREWSMRFSHEFSYYRQSNSMFLTLTYNKENLPDNYSLCKRDYQNYLKRLRKAGYKFKYMVAGEYGILKGRPHYHLVIFGIPNENPLKIRDLYTIKDCKYKTDKTLFQKWNKGKIQIGYVSNKSIEYCCKYILKQDHKYLNDKEYFALYNRIKPFRRVSKGIGKQFAIDNARNLYENLFIYFGSNKLSIPRTYIKYVEKYAKLPLLTKIQEKCLIDKDKEIQRLYRFYNLTPKSVFDFDNVNEYYDLYNHDKLYKIVENANSVKEYKYINRHYEYLLRLKNEKLLIADTEIA